MQQKLRQQIFPHVYKIFSGKTNQHSKTFFIFDKAEVLLPAFQEKILFLIPFYGKENGD